MTMHIDSSSNYIETHSHCEYLSQNEYERVYEQEWKKIEKLAG